MVTPPSGPPHGMVAVIESETTGKMEKIVREINRKDDLLHVGLTFINVEE